MRSLPKPNLTDEEGNPLTAVDVFKLCINVVRNKDLKTRLRAIAPLIEAAAEEYDSAADAGTLHTVVREAVVGGNVTNDELKKVYTGRMVPTGLPGRPVYDAILAGAPGDRCPLCGVGTVNTLDHHLPKSEYSSLTVTPNNLIPSCTWCQDSKMETYPTIEEEQTIHPYFDDFETHQWLKAVVRHTAPATFEFSVTAPVGWDAVKVERARNHLKTFSLDALFSSNAAEELTNIRQRLADLLASGNEAS